MGIQDNSVSKCKDEPGVLANCSTIFNTYICFGYPDGIWRLG